MAIASYLLFMGNGAVAASEVAVKEEVGIVTTTEIIKEVSSVTSEKINNTIEEVRSETSNVSVRTEGASLTVNKESEQLKKVKKN